jgi:hypothetical protein
MLTAQLSYKEESCFILAFFIIDPDHLPTQVAYPITAAFFHDHSPRFLVIAFSTNPSKRRDFM